MNATIQKTDPVEEIIKDLIKVEERLADLGEDGDLRPDSDLLKSVQRSLAVAGYRKVSRGRLQFWLPIDVWVIAWPDNLEHYTFPDWLDGKVESIEEIRFFDKNTITHLCSFEGSYWTEFLEMRVTLKPEFADDDGLQDRAYDWVRNANIDTKSDYLGQTQTDHRLDSGTRDNVYHYGNPRLDWDAAVEGAKAALYSDIWNNRHQKKLPTDEKTLDAIIAAHVEADGGADRMAADYIMESLREHFQANSVL